jgi:hypothetical protein
MEDLSKKSDVTECESDQANKTPTGSVEATVRRGQSDIRLNIAPIIAHDRQSLIAALQSVKHKLNECLTDLVNEEKAVASTNTSKKTTSFTAEDSDNDEDDKGMIFH